jgi:hypothetical protein
MLFQRQAPPIRIVKSKAGHLPEDEIKFTIECEREEDGRWLAEVLELPGVLTYGSTQEQGVYRKTVGDCCQHSSEVSKPSKSAQNSPIKTMDDLCRPTLLRCTQNKLRLAPKR